MKWLFIVLILMLLTSSACHKDDEILPVPPATEKPAPISPPEEIEDEVASPENLETESFQYGRFRNIPYRILVPRGYDSIGSYPLHVFLHGIGERGVDNEKHLAVGGAYYQQDSIRSRYHSFVVFPQCPPSDYWFDNNIITTLKALIDTLQVMYVINDKEISIGGFSMGAFGTFAMTAHYPGLFQSAVAISGDGDEKKASLMAKASWQIFAGKKDDIVPPGKTKKMAEALLEAGASVSFMLFPNADHGETWQRAFEQPAFFYNLFPVEIGKPKMNN